MQVRDGIFIPMELVHAFMSAVLLIGALFIICCAGYYLWRGLRRLGHWLRMSKVDRAKAYLRDHDPEFRRHEQMQGLVRRLRTRGSRESSTKLSQLFRKKA